VEAESGSVVTTTQKTELSRSQDKPIEFNQIGELAAILIALQKLEPFTPISFKTDSRYVIDGLTIHPAAAWEDRGWINIANSELFRATAYQLRRRSAQTSFEWIKGHTGDHGNEAADRLANEGANKDVSDNINLTIPNEFNLQGAKLSSITQAIAYHGIRTMTQLTPRRATTINLDMARHAVKDISNHLETDATIWKNCRRKELRKPIQQFLYKAMHGTFKMGEFWDRIPQHEHRAICSLCHESRINGTHTTHGVSKPGTNNHLDPDKRPLARNGAWPNLTIGTILGCGSIALPLCTGS
jgi:ribonuclease HI